MIALSILLFLMLKFTNTNAFYYNIKESDFDHFDINEDSFPFDDINSENKDIAYDLFNSNSFNLSEVFASNNSNFSRKKDSFYYFLYYFDLFKSTFFSNLSTSSINISEIFDRSLDNNRYDSIFQKANHVPGLFLSTFQLFCNYKKKNKNNSMIVYNLIKNEIIENENINLEEGNIYEPFEGPNFNYRCLACNDSLEVLLTESAWIISQIKEILIEDEKPPTLEFIQQKKSPNIDQDEDKIAEYKMRIEADGNNSYDFIKLAEAFLQGDFHDGIHKNPQKAFEIFNNTIFNNSRSMLYLGFLYYYGKGTPVNYNKSFEYFTQASQNTFRYADVYLGLHYENGQGVGKNLTKAMEYYQKAYYFRCRDADAHLANIFLSNKNKSLRNTTQAINQFERFSTDSSSYTLFTLGRCFSDKNFSGYDCQNASDYLFPLLKYSRMNYFLFQGFKQFIKKKYMNAFNNYLIAGLAGIKEGFSSAAFILENYDLGIKCKYKNPHYCVLILQYMALKLGDTNMACKIGDFFFDKEKISKNFTISFHLYYHCSDTFDFEGRYNLAYMIENGFGTEKNITLAMKEYDSLKGSYTRDSNHYFPVLISEWFCYFKSLRIVHYLNQFFSIIMRKFF